MQENRMRTGHHVCSNDKNLDDYGNGSVRRRVFVCLLKLSRKIEGKSGMAISNDKFLLVSPREWKYSFPFIKPSKNWPKNKETNLLIPVEAEIANVERLPELDVVRNLENGPRRHDGTSFHSNHQALRQLKISIFLGFIFHSNDSSLVTASANKHSRKALIVVFLALVLGICQRI